MDRWRCSAGIVYRINLNNATWAVLDNCLFLATYVPMDRWRCSTGSVKRINLVTAAKVG